MSKEIIPELVPKEPWMTQALQKELTQCAQGGKITCIQAHRFAHDHGLELSKMKLLMDSCSIKLKECQLGCF
jgi:hypothetical protein